MILSTQIPLKKQPHNLIDYNANLLLLGSCFSENISEKLTYYKFNALVNPFGILFNPKAIEVVITNSINQKEYTENDIFFFNEQWNCFDTHSSLSNTNKDTILKQLNNSTNTTYQKLKTATHVIITLGTAWVYREIASDKIVANCHKVPQKKFLKELLSVDEIASSIEAINSLLKSVNRNINIIYTISPVRHLKDGFIENQQSKAHLLAAIHSAIEPRNSIYYFPSYEIMMDELRDYRFYAEDMIHPNETAINYIWEKFTDAWFSENSFQTMKEVETIQRGLAHKPFNKNSEAHKEFLRKLNQKIHKTTKHFPNISF